MFNKKFKKSIFDNSDIKSKIIDFVYDKLNTDMNRMIYLHDELNLKDYEKLFNFIKYTIFI